MIRIEIDRSETDQDGIGEVVLYGYATTLPTATVPFWWVCAEVDGDEINVGHFDTLEEARESFLLLTTGSEEN